MQLRLQKKILPINCHFWVSIIDNWNCQVLVIEITFCPSLDRGWTSRLQHKGRSSIINYKDKYVTMSGLTLIRRCWNRHLGLNLRKICDLFKKTQKTVVFSKGALRRAPVVDNLQWPKLVKTYGKSQLPHDEKYRPNVGFIRCTNNIEKIHPPFFGKITIFRFFLISNQIFTVGSDPKSFTYLESAINFQ